MDNPVLLVAVGLLGLILHAALLYFIVRSAVLWALREHGKPAAGPTPPGFYEWGDDQTLR